MVLGFLYAMYLHMVFSVYLLMYLHMVFSVYLLMYLHMVFSVYLLMYLHMVFSVYLLMYLHMVFSVIFLCTYMWYLVSIVLAELNYWSDFILGETDGDCSAPVACCGDTCSKVS